VLGERSEFADAFDFVICCENMEHILDDEKLITDIASCLKPGGALLLTTPNINYKPITREDNEPFYPIEDGRHVRRGYSEGELVRLCGVAGLTVVGCSYLSWFFSQKITAVMRTLGGINPFLGWGATLPLRLLPLLLARSSTSNRPAEIRALA